MTGAMIVIATLASYAAGWALGVPILVPILNTLASYPFRVAALRRGELRRAVERMLLWALTMGVVATLLSYARPADTGQLFIRASAYRIEMFNWCSPAGARRARRPSSSRSRSVMRRSSPR